MATTRKEWTFMVYLAGDNNLADAGLADLKEMKAIGSTSDVNIVAQFDNGLENATRRYYLTKGTSLAKDVIKDLGPTNTGDPKVLQDFVTRTAADYPAKRYALVLWNHGAGWDDEDIYRLARSMKFGVQRRGTTITRGTRGTVPFDQLRGPASRRFRRSFFKTPLEYAIRDRAIAFDDSAKDFLDNVELKSVLGKLKSKLKQKIDLLGMDACLMSMAEVLYQVRQGASVTVGSEEVEPGDGWPYNSVLQELAARPTMDARELGAIVVEKYLKSYSANSNVTQAASDLAHIDALLKSLNGFAGVLLRHLKEANGKLDILQARMAAQTYDTPDYVDLANFCDLLAGSTDSEPVRDACRNVFDAVLHSGLVINSGYKGKRVKNSNGVSIYFPQLSVSKLYAKLDLAKKSQWDKFLAKYVEAVRKPAGSRAMAAVNS